MQLYFKLKTKQIVFQTIPLFFCNCWLSVFVLLWRQISSRLQEGVPLVPIHQGVHLRRAGTTLHPAAPDTPEQHVHADANGYHHGCSLRPRWGQRQRWRQKALFVFQEEKLHHRSPLWGQQRQQCKNTKRSGTKGWSWRILLKSVMDMHKALYKQNTH